MNKLTRGGAEHYTAAAPTMRDPFNWREFDEDPRALWLLCALTLAFIPAFLRLAGPALPSVSGAAWLTRVPVLWLPEPLVFLAPTNILRQALTVLVLLVPCVFYLCLLGRRRWAAGLVLVLAGARLYLYGLNAFNMTNYYHAHLLLLGLVLLLPAKSFGVRAGLCLLYWLAGISKLSPSWLNGEYFQSLPSGLPLLHDGPAMITFASLAVVSLELGAPFLLLSRRDSVRRAGLAAFAAFHAYSALIVGVEYPFLFLPVLFAAFGEVPGARDPAPPRGTGLYAIGGVLLVATLWSQRHWLLPGARALTSEGRQGGVFMFDANAGCRVALDLEWPGRSVLIRHDTGYRNGVRRRDGVVEPARDVVSAVARENGRERALTVDGGVVRLEERALYDGRVACDIDKRVCCDPAFFHAYLARLQKRDAPARMGLRLEVALNGWPYWHVLVDEKDFDPKRLRYDSLRHNEWIRPADAAAPASYRWP